LGFFLVFLVLTPGAKAGCKKPRMGVDLPDNFTLQLRASRQKAFVFSNRSSRERQDGDPERTAGRSKVGCDGQTPFSALSL